MAKMLRNPGKSKIMVLLICGLFSANKQINVDRFKLKKN